MSIFNLEEAQRRAAQRLGSGTGRGRRSRRADAGSFRLDALVREKLIDLLGGQEKPPLVTLLGELQAFCRKVRRPCPTRATVYSFMARGEGHRYRIAELPEAVQACLYNLQGTAEVPGHQLAFYAFHHGGSRATCFAAGLPWLDLYQAGRLPGWRPRSRGLLEAVLRVRGI